MRFLLASLLMALLGISAVQAQTSSTIKLKALEPQASDLERLNIVAAWRMYLPLKNENDAVSVVQPINDRVYVQLRSGLLLAIQAYANPKTFRKPGEIIWRYQPHAFAGFALPVAEISKLMEIEGKLKPVSEVYAVYGQQLVVLDAADGKVKFTEELPSTAINGPIADETTVYVPLGNRRIIAYFHTKFIDGYAPRQRPTFPDPPQTITLEKPSASELSTVENRAPSITALNTTRPPFIRTNSIDISPSVGGLKNFTPPYRQYEGNRSPSVGTMRHLRDIYDQSSMTAQTRIKRTWEVQLPGKIVDTPILYSLTEGALTHSGEIPEKADIVITSTGRSVITMPASSLTINSIKSEYIAPSEISAALTHHGDSLYVCTADSSVVSLSIRQIADPSMAKSLLPRGKFTAGGPIEQQPLLVNDSLYLVGSRWGLIRLKKTTLEPMWIEAVSPTINRSKPNEEVTSVLAANAKYVYALDRNGALLVLDALRGTTLSKFNVAAFNLRAVNQRNDRLYLASPSGLLLCLHDRNLVTPQQWNVGNRDVIAALQAAAKKEEGAIPKKDGEPAPKKDGDPEPKKDDPEMKKDPAPKKGPAPKKDDEEMKKDDPEMKKDPAPKKGLAPKKDDAEMKKE